MAPHSAVDGRAALLRRVDGVPHVVLGPPLLAAVTPLARVTGARPGMLVAVLGPYTAYGVAVIAGTQQKDAPPERWLVVTAVAANTAAIVVGAAAVIDRRSTRVGRLVGAGLAAGGLGMVFGLRAP